MLYLKYKNIFLSLATIVLWTLLVFAFFYKDSDFGKTFGIVLMFIVTKNFAVGFGALVVVLRLFRVIKSHANFLFVLATILNLAIALLATILFLAGKFDMPTLHEFLLCLVIGGILVVDYLFWKNN